MRITKGKEDRWNAWVENNKDPYGRHVITFAERWANLMEHDINISGMSKAVRLFEDRSHQADTDGITGFMYGCAVQILSDVWEYGETLRKWYNKEYGYKGDGVVNPAILTIEG